MGQVIMMLATNEPSPMIVALAIGLSIAWAVVWSRAAPEEHEKLKHVSPARRVVYVFLSALAFPFLILGVVRHPVIMAALAFCAFIGFGVQLFFTGTIDTGTEYYWVDKDGNRCPPPFPVREPGRLQRLISVFFIMVVFTLPVGVYVALEWLLRNN